MATHITDLMSIEQIMFYRQNPVKFIEDAILKPLSSKWGKNLSISDQQRKVIEAIATNKRVSVSSGRGIGKTTLLAWIAIWFTSLHDKAKTIITSPSRNQLKSSSFPEIKKWIVGTHVEKLFKMTSEKIYVEGDLTGNSFIEARTAVAGSPESMSGLHAESLLILIDEASNVSDDIFRTLLNTLTGENNKIAAFSNPTRVVGSFYDIYHDDPHNLWVKFMFSSEDSPHTSKELIEDLKLKYGENHSIYKVDVLGQFPEASDDTFISLAQVMQAMSNEVVPPGNEVHIGVDIARFGADNSVWFWRMDNKVYPPIVKGQTSGPDVVNQTIELVKLIRNKYHFMGKINIKVDAGGLGSGPYDYLKTYEHEHNIEVIECVANKTSENSRYGNETSWAWGCLRDKIGEISLPTEDECENHHHVRRLREELSARRVDYTSGKIRMESKKVFKKEFGRSPDMADALVLCFLEKRGEKSVIRDFDPADNQMVIKRPTYCSDYYEYCSIFYSSARTISIVYGRYGNGELIITHEHLTDDNVSAVASHILNSKPTGFKKIIANDKCFGKATRDDIRGQLRRDRIRIKPIAGYDELGAIELLNELTAQNNFKVLNKCHTTADQIYNWRVDTTKFELENNYGLCYAVLGLVFELREFIKPTKKAPRVREAYAPKNDDKSVTDMRSKYIASLR